jgi:flagellar hook-associated protein 3 FlgL
MRISTNNLYEQQTNAMDNLLFTQANLGNQLSTGKTLNQPQDDPSQISQDLQLRNTIANVTTSAQNTQQASDELTQVDSTLGELTSALQSARQLTVAAASDVMNPSNKLGVANQVEKILEQLVSLANTQYGGKYLFGGTNLASVPPVQTTGTPITSVNFTGNQAQQGELYADGAQVSLSTTLQQAFNFNASDGSLNVFQVLINLRNTLNDTGPISINGAGTSVAGNAIDQSAQPVNGAGQIVDATAALGPQANAFANPLQFPAGQFQFQIDSGSGSQLFTITNADAMDGGPTSVVGQINAATAVTGVTATWDERTQKLTLASNAPYTVTDVTGNFTRALGLTQQSDATDNLSRQLGDIDNVLTAALVSRSSVGQSLDTLSTLTNRYNTSATNDTAAQSQIEDANFPNVTSQFTETQTALQAAYSTTSRLEAKTLMDYL